MSYYLNYSPYCDYATLIIILVFFLLIKSSFYSGTRKNKIFRCVLILLFIATMSNTFYMTLIDIGKTKYIYLVYIFRNIANSLLIILLSMFIKYMFYMFEDGKKHKYFFASVVIPLFLSIIMMITSPFTKIGFYINKNGIINGNYYFDPFSIAYVYFCIIIFIQLIKYRKNMLTRAFYVMMATFFISVELTALESFIKGSSFLCLTFLLPVMVVYALFHSNPYNIETGTLDRSAFEDYLIDLDRNNVDFHIISLLLKKDNDLEEFLKNIRNELMHFYEKYFIESYTFRLKDNRFVLVYKDVNKKYPKKEFLKEFINVYERCKIDYKLVSIDSASILEKNKNYLDYIRYLEKKIDFNSFYEGTEYDLNSFLEYLFILKQLKDISIKKDINDERIVVYCQPIYDVKTKKVKSAEALMRLKINERIIYPDKFIKVAEENHLIHQLSLTILNKVCKKINELEKDNYDIERISVNFSTSEFENYKTIEEIKNTIKRNKIKPVKLGIEITETETTTNFDEVVKNVNLLSKDKMKIYLDDFGTGYSNFERITKLPFDIVKFDKSLLEAIKNDSKFKLMNISLSETYKEIGYELLFEGIENKMTADMCIKDMHADYLQGYHISRPIPIDELDSFLSKKRKRS